MASISSSPTEFKYFFHDRELGVKQTTDSHHNLKLIQDLAQKQIRDNSITNAKNIKVLKNGTVQILGDRDTPLHSFSISKAKEMLEKAFSPVKSLVASSIADPNDQEQVLKETSAHIPAEPAASTRGSRDSRLSPRDGSFQSTPETEEPLGSSRSLRKDLFSSRDFSEGRASSASRFPSSPERAEEIDDVEELKAQLDTLTVENRKLQAELKAKEALRPAEDTAALKATLFATRKEKYDLEISKNNQKAAELEQFLNHLQAFKVALEDREDTVDIFSKSSIALRDYFSQEIKEEKAFQDKMIAKENKAKTWAETGISFLSLGAIGTRGDADRISDVDDEMEAVRKLIKELKQRNTLLTNLKEVNDPDLLQIREECHQAESEITKLQKERDSLIKTLGGDSTNIKDKNYAFTNLTSLKDKKDIASSNAAKGNLQAEVKRLKEVVANLNKAADNQARCRSLRDAASEMQQTLSSMLKRPHTLEKLPSLIAPLTDGNLENYNTSLTDSLALLKKRSDELTYALNALTAVNVT